MAWHLSPYPELWPGATEAETREWWEGYREHHNRFAEKFNRNWLNRLFGYRIDVVPTYDAMNQKFKRLRGE